MLFAETKPIKPGEWNSQDLVVKNHLLEQFHILKLMKKKKTGAVTQYLLM